MMLAGISALETGLLILIGIICLTVMGIITYKTLRKGKKNKKNEQENEEVIEEPRKNDKV